VLLSLKRIGVVLPANGAAARASTKLASAEGAKMAVSAVFQPASATATAVSILPEPKSRAVVTPVSAKALNGVMLMAIPAIAKLAKALFAALFFIW
jgi:hypothetical protein